MAKVTITFEDNEDGLTLSIVSDPMPEKNGRDTELTYAQKMAARALLLLEAAEYIDLVPKEDE